MPTCKAAEYSFTRPSPTPDIGMLTEGSANKEKLEESFFSMPAEMLNTEKKCLLPVYVYAESCSVL